MPSQASFPNIVYLSSLLFSVRQSTCGSFPRDDFQLINKSRECSSNSPPVFVPGVIGAQMYNSTAARTRDTP
ncbi:hypothetical protein E2C01_060416 [Portunus trituberculatus]|uniref:Uncharacterized protein n=1 Tax=Portunus trituberculatus TaxID=210409 RepID=A0A5B7H8T5_PORTR|nr:hypothetical protein [Portunus trituberculatus]